LIGLEASNFIIFDLIIIKLNKAESDKMKKKGFRSFTLKTFAALRILLDKESGFVS
jgi:hypothetical protein